MGCLQWLGELSESFWTALENGSFKSYARGCAVINVLLLFWVPVLCLVTMKMLPITTFVLLLIFSVVLGVVELPFCCMWFNTCRTIATYMKIFEIYWIRAILYIALGTVLISVAVHVDQNNPATWYFGIILPAISILYFIASCKGEKSSLDEVEAKPAASATIPPAVVHDVGTNRATAKHESDAESLGPLGSIGLTIASDEKVQRAAFDAAASRPDLLRDAIKAAAGSKV